MQPDQAPTKRRARSRLSLFDTLMVFLKEFFQEVHFEKFNRQQKIMIVYASGASS